MGRATARGEIFEGTNNAHVNPLAIMKIISLLMYLLIAAVINIKNATTRIPFALKTPKKILKIGNFERI